MVINFQSLKKAGNTERRKKKLGWPNTVLYFIIQRTDKQFIIDHIILAQGCDTAADVKKICRIFGYDGVK